MKDVPKIPILFILAFLFTGCGQNPAGEPLLDSLPETEGVSSQGIIDFLKAADDCQGEFHSFLFLRHGRVIAEAYWAPYTADLRNTLYSATKSFTSTAVGLAVSEGKLSVDDPVVSFFKDELPDTLTEYQSMLTVEDLLTMSAGQDPIHGTIASEPDWVKVFWQTPIKYEPGTVFRYSSLCSHMLSAILQEATGEKLSDYLGRRLFEPLGIEGWDWETDPQGINTGGWGLRLKSGDMARFGQMLLREGEWQGKQVVPAGWIHEAGSKKIQQRPELPQAVKDSSDWLQGYGYQFWQCRHNAFRADGANGQFIVVMPDQDAVVVITSETIGGQYGGMRDELNLVWEYLLPVMHPEPLPPDPAAYDRLREKMASLDLPVPPSAGDPDLMNKYVGRSFSFNSDSVGIKTLSFGLNGDTLLVKTQAADEEFSLRFGADFWLKGETMMDGSFLFPGRETIRGPAPPHRVAGAFRRTPEGKMQLFLRYLETPHTVVLTCSCDGEEFMIEPFFSRNPRMQVPSLTGKMMQIQ